MDRSEFWSIIERSSPASTADRDTRLARLEEALARLPVPEVVAFDALFHELRCRAYTWDLWAAAYLLNGGCSDDGFMDFRSWLVSLGRTRFERALLDADSLADVPVDDDEEGAAFEEFGYVASRVVEARTGRPLPPSTVVDGPSPAGEPFEESEEHLARRLPRLWAAHGW